MRITFHGAAREVTGSCHLLELGEKKLLLDCGMIQGGKERHDRNRAKLPFAHDLSAVVLSHAHIDHCGRLPLLRRAGFRGPIYATQPTVELCKILLADSGRLHEEDAEWKIKRLRKKREDFSWVTPLYTEKEALDTMDQFVPVDFGKPQEIDGLGEATFRLAGHILGAAIIELSVRENGRTHTLAFSGDLGVHGARLLGPPREVACPEWLLIESTYGNREREESEDRTAQLERVIERTFERGGKVVIPSFAVGRTQELLARLNDIIDRGPRTHIPVFVDSPMAIAATAVFKRHPEVYSEGARDLLESGDDPLRFPGLEVSRSVEESRAINDHREPCVVIAGSGMCTGGRVKHHLKHNISDAKNTLLFVGYQARGTLGWEIQRGTSPVRIFGEHYPVRAQIETIEGFSAHADRSELLAWFEGLNGVPRRTFVVHGEEEASLAFGETLTQRFGAEVTVPEPGKTYAMEGAVAR